MSTLAANLRARLNRDELHQLRWLLGLALVLLAFWTLYNLDVGGFAWRTVFFAIAAAALMFPGWPGHIPEWVRRWSFILGAAALFTEFIATKFDFISGLVLLVSLLTLSRGLQYRRLREDWQLILLCLFIIILSGVLTLSLWFGLQILIFTLVAMALLFVMNLVEGDAGRALTTADWKNFRWGRFARKVRHAIDLRQLIQASALFVGLVLFSSLIFVSIPRFQFAQSFSIGGQRGVAGFHGDITYADKRGIDNDDSIAFRVSMPNFILSKTPYWRMIVLDDYRDNGFRLSGSTLLEDFGWHSVVRYSGMSHPGDPPFHLNDARSIPGVVNFFIEGNVSEYLPILGPFDTLTFSSTQDFRAMERVKIYRTVQPSPKLFGYQVEGMDLSDSIPATADELKPTVTAENAEAARKINPKLAYPLSYFGLPANGDDRAIVHAIVEQIKAGHPEMTENEFIAAAVNYLRKNHAGSMDVDLTRAHSNLVEGLKPNDFLVQWLDSTSPGWCEHFAGSFVLLCREAGFPARVVAGYKGAVYNSIDNYYSVPQSDAHAWAEVLDTTLRDRWQRVDPSPGSDSSLPGASSSSLAGITTDSGWGAFIDGLRMIWYRRVINFDQTDQQELVAKVSESAKGFGASVQEWLATHWAATKLWFSEPLTPGKAGVLSVLLVVMELVFLFRRRLRNLWLRLSLRLWPHAVRQLPPVRLDAGRWLRRFQPVWQMVEPALPAPAREEWTQVRRDLLTLRYGPPDFPADPAGTFRKARLLLRKAKGLNPSRQ